MNIFDVNKEYNTPAERLLAAQSMLRRTTYGQGNVVRAELDGDVVVFVNNANPGVRHATLEKAFAEAGRLELTQVSSVIRQGRQVTASTIGRRKQAGNRVGAAAGFVGDIFDKLRSLDQRNLQALADAGIDVADLLANGNVDILTMHAPSGGSKNIATRISEMRRNGEAHGITLIDDEGARILQFRSGQRMLNSYQANLLLTVTRHGLIDRDSLKEIMREGNSGELAKTLMKIPKRARSIIAERELSISGGELSRFIGRGARNLEEAFLITDPQYEILRKYSGLDLGNTMLDEYYRNLNPENYVREVFQKFYVDKKQMQLAEDRLKQAIIDFSRSRPDEFKFASDELLNFLKNRFSGNNQMQAVVKGIFDRIEYSFDGSDLLNVDYLKKYIGGLNSEIRNIKSTLPNLSGNALIEARRRISELEGTVSQLSKGIEYGEQISGRGNIVGKGNIKTAFQVTELSNAFKRKAGIISKFGLKGELGLAGDVDSLLMSGFGVARDAVFTDPVSVAFHPEVFADADTIEAIRARSSSILDEFKDSINDNVLPQKLRKMLEQSANLNPMDLKPELRASALRNRQFAQAILDMHAAGLSPRNAPQMMNMLHSVFAAQAYREKKGFLQAVLPDAYRFALDSESITHGTNRRALLGTGYETVSMRSSTGQSVSNDLVKFRVTGHKMMFAEGVIQDIREALGGFDLDDKGIPKLTTFTDENGRSRIAFHVTRQPSGVEERMLARASMDVETLQALFGQNEKFIQQLESMMPGTGQTAEELLHAIITGSGTRQDQTVDEYVASLNRRVQGGQITLPSGFTSFEDLMEETVRKVYEGMERRGITKLSTLTDEMVSVFGEFGTARLAEKALSGERQFTREGIFKIFEQAGAFDMRDDFRALLEDPNVILNTDTRGFITEILDDTRMSFDDMLMAMSQRFADDPAIETLMNLAFQEKSINMAKEGGDILGVYVNRSMVIGSTLNQYQDFLNNLLTSNPGTTQRRAMEYMLRNMQVGLLSQETAIDLSVNFSGTKRRLEQVGRAALESVNRVGAEAAIQTALQGLGGVGSGITLDQIGQNIIEETGRRIGFARSLEEGEAIGMGIDRMLIEQKLSNMDQRKLLQGIIAGTQEAIDQGFATSAGAADFIASANEVITKGENIQEFLLSNFGISAGSRYASLSALDQSTTAAQFEAVKKGAMRRIVRDQALASVQVSSQSEAVARAIVERYSDSIEQMYSTIYGNYDQMNEMQVYSNQGRLQKLGESILDDIEAGSKIQGVTLQDLVNAIDQQFEGKRFNLRELKFITDGVEVTKYEEMFQNIMDIRTLRNAEYFSKMDQLAGGMASNVRTRIEDELGESLNLASVEQKARQLLERQQPLDEDVADVLRYMLGETDLIGEGLDETAAGIARAEAERVANVINFMLRGEEVGQRNPSLQTIMQQIGDINSASQINENDTILRDMFDMYNQEIAEDGDVQKASYKRIGDYIRDKDYQQLLDDKLIRRGVMGMGALILGSLAYSTYKDRTHQDVQGPPLLPGGSAYEGMPARVPQIPGYANSGYNQGNNYRVSINGSQEDIENFNAAASGLSNATMNTTIYNRIPDLSGNAITSLMDFLG